MMTSPQQQLQHIHSLLSPGEIFEQGSDGYKEQSQPWSTWADRHPKLVVRPTSLESMQKVVKYLYSSTLDFGVRNTGTGSVSAQDVLLSTHGFKSFSFDQASETVTIGAGFDWGEIDQLMEERAPDYAVVGARCSWVGVTGSALVGGLSWLSHEFGMISDPQNLIDMQIVLSDGRVVWAAKEEPELMWALRGGGGNFGVVTALVLRARPYPRTVFAGILFYPYSSLSEISKHVARMAADTADPKVAMHVINRGPGMGETPSGAKPGIGIMMYDANGEEHARSEHGFQWAFEASGATIISEGVMSLRHLNGLADTFRDWQGKNMFWACAPLIENIDDETLVRAWKWYEESVELHPGFDEGSTVLLEFMQENAMNSSGSRTATAWPHSGRRHVMQLLLGCKPEGAPAGIRDIVMKQFSKAGKQIALENDPKEYHAGFLHEWNDLSEVYGENLEKLRTLKRRFDPKNRFNKGVDLARSKITEGMTV